MVKKSKKVTIIVTLVLLTAVIAYFVLNIFFSPYWDSVYPAPGYFSLASMRSADSDSETFSHEKACADIDYIIGRLGRVHPECIKSVPENVLECAEREKSSFGDAVTTYELWRSAARVLHEMGDANCIAAPSFSMNYLTDYSKMLDKGCSLAAVNGESVDDIFSRNSDIISYDIGAEAWGKSVVQGFAGTREGLKFLGIDESELVFTYKYPNGSVKDKTYSSSDFYNYQAAKNDSETADQPYYSDIFADKNAAVMTLDSCVYSMEYKEFVYKFFTDTAESGAENVIIDLRSNSGGTSEVLDEIMMYLDKKSFRTPGGDWRLGHYMMHWDSEETKIINMDVETLFSGDIYVLTSSDTFGSATLMAEILADNGFAKLAGEPCGNMPDGYGDVAVFQTPNAAITFEIPTKHFERIDKSKSGQPLSPDIECNAADALDRVLDVISNNKNK